MITFHQDVVVYEISRGGYGNSTKKNEQHLKGRVKEKYQLVKDKSAIETVSELEITLPPNANVKTDYKIGYGGNDYTIISYKFIRNTIGDIVKKVVYC